MLTLNLGPLALPLSPLLLLVFLFATSWAVRRHAQPQDREAADGAVWWAVAAGLLAARVAHVLSHWSSYTESPADMLDIRDAGFMLLPGVLAGVVVMVWRVRRTVLNSARVVLATAGAGLLLWLLAAGSVQWFKPAPGQHLRELAVTLEPFLTSPAVEAGSPTPSASVPSSAIGAPQASSSPTASMDPVPPSPQTLQAIAQAAGGKPVVLNLWATWCGPCRAEMPLLARAQREHPEVLFILANQGESAAAIQAYLQRERLQFDHLWRDTASALGPAVGSSGLPTTVYFDAQGRPVGAHVGVLTEGALKVIVRKVSQPAGSS